MWAFGLLGESLPGLTVPFEEHDLQDLEEMPLVRADNFQFPIGSSSSPSAKDMKCCSTFAICCTTELNIFAPRVKCAVSCVCESELSEMQVSLYLCNVESAPVSFSMARSPRDFGALRMSLRLPHRLFVACQSKSDNGTCSSFQHALHVQ